ncbi:MAG: hypothetical protein RI575_01590 [Balneolaceae bacterium]|nr:hypothetical protein [Balneolaceae bacterium]MDR9407784.1 hypothetical protein [Balneolaceae bacterium]
MKNDANKYEIFNFGSQWLRADFHLHTKADKEAFKNWDETEKRSFKQEYVARLKEENISVGVITNHNKFDEGEYKSLAKEARKNEIFLLPGVEFSVNDGQSGVHVCIVFDPDSWLTDGDDFINRFLNEAYPGLSENQRANRNDHSDWSLKELLKKLNEYHIRHNREAFVILAHVDQSKGFFHEINKTRIDDLFQEQLFKNYVLGFQKVSSRDSLKLINEHFENDSIARVEGSDCKSFNTIGKTRSWENKKVESFIKIGDFNFLSIKYALMDKNRNTVASSKPVPTHSRIKKVWFETAFGTPLHGKDLLLNDDLNSLIGIRGSGKSTILETIRFGVGKNIDSNTSKDDDYKNRLVQRTLKSGGKVLVDIETNHGQNYRVERIFGERPSIFRDGVKLPDFTIDENILSVLYFGQKDLSEIGTEGFSQNLMEKFFGSNVGPIREKIDNKVKDILRMITEIKQLNELSGTIQETKEEIAALKERMEIFKKKKIDEKLQRQVQFNKDRNHLKQMSETGESFVMALRRTISEYQEGIKELKNYTSKENVELFEKAYKSWKYFIEKIEKVKAILDSIDDDLADVKTYEEELRNLTEKLQDEFAEIKRSIDLKDLNPDDYVKFSKRHNLLETKLKELEKRERKREDLKVNLNRELSQLKSLWHDEYKTFQKSIDELNNRDLSIKVELIYRGDKSAFQDFVKNTVQGSGITGRKIEQLTEEYNDPIELYFDLDEERSDLQQILSGGTHLAKFKEYFLQNLSAALTFQVPNRFVLRYHGKDIKGHSLGQRASAIMVFLLARQENDVIIIDQPEDDIDNQSIYRDVISELKNLKGKTQFIFATHNPNIPVLGESEQVFVCDYEGDSLSVDTGSIDTEKIQTAIIDIMEGGREAFEQRERKYQEWMH